MEVLSAQIPFRELAIQKDVGIFPQATVETLATHVKMDYFRINCYKCSEDYSDERVPRTLKCGHSLCTPCVEEFLDSEMICPECHEKQHIKSVRNLPVNYPLLKLTRSLGNNTIDFSDSKKPTFFADIPSSNTDLKEVSKCGVHGSPILLFCSSCSAWVCQDCLVINHPFLPRGSCRILELKEGMDLVNSERRNVANHILKDINNMERTFDFELAIHDFCLKYCSGNKRSHVSLIKKTESQLEEVKKNNNSLVEKVKECVRKSIALSETTESPEEMTASCKELSDCQNDLKDDIKKAEENRLPVLDIMLQHLKKDLKRLVKGRVPVYALTDEGKASRWAQITRKKTNLLLYSLNDGRPPKKGITIPFEYAKKLQLKYWKIVFFEIGTEEKKLGRIFVRFGEETPLIEQMVLMCSGEKGVSYKGTCFYKYDEEEGHLHGGDYENNDGTGGRPIVKGIGDCHADKFPITFAGSLMADRVSTRFHFSLKYMKCLEDENVETIGYVTSGLKVLLSLSKVEPGRKSIIRDCGIVIPMKLD